MDLVHVNVLAGWAIGRMAEWLVMVVVLVVTPLVVQAHFYTLNTFLGIVGISQRL